MSSKDKFETVVISTALVSYLYFNRYVLLFELYAMYRSFKGLRQRLRKAAL